MTTFQPSPMASYLEKLERRRSLPPDERAALLSLPTRVKHYKSQSAVTREGDDASRCVFALDGLLSRQKTVDGSRQIVSISFPGDAADLQTLFFKKTDDALITHRQTSVAFVRQADIIALCDGFPLLTKMLWHDTLVDSAIFREWQVNVGHRRAPLRIGFFLLEYETRLAAIGKAQDGVFELHFTQQELASALGLSLVHFNRSLRWLREEKLIGVHKHITTILDKPRLSRLTGFDAEYLHQTSTPTLEEALRSPAAHPSDGVTFEVQDPPSATLGRQSDSACS